MRQLLLLFLLTFSSYSMADWIEYSQRPNGDVYFFDNARVESHDSQISVWTRVRYKTSLMGAFSYQSHLNIDCAENTESVLQSTFYSDADWNKKAMATNTNAKPKKNIKPNSATGLLVKILCKS